MSAARTPTPDAALHHHNTASQHIHAALHIALLGSLIGCAPLPDPEPMPVGDAATFAATVQPVVDERCATPSCHGRPERPLSLFSPLHYRRDPARTFLDEPLDADELDANVRRTCAFTLDLLREHEAVDACLVLRKPLAVAAGGARHEGGEIFRAVDDRDYRTLRAWLATVQLPASPRGTP
jgi:hypothetical protein